MTFRWETYTCSSHIEHWQEAKDSPSKSSLESQKLPKEV